jgi:Fe2+ or Zn2+ uptake regulation protein
MMLDGGVCLCYAYTTTNEGSKFMAWADYFFCDVCDRVKCFYDAELDYRSGRVSERTGKKVPGDSGDVAAICDSCIKTHEIVIQKRKKKSES